ncbi:MAG: hypothetical protein DCF25_03945 [Leptolyngbya foveolarum]|uniref:Uncharacterized protein n=1 Tax=Leptolyngbya foveolarum TaxID=47253 RepID=A0A2W4WHX9_9CYAN|nr:MAG: hypothetical protein DCF25_03945 [Leptolyngbya foveolarum]
MIILTSEEITRLKSSFAEMPVSLESLREIGDCDGDVEDAAISLALRSNQEPDTNEQWLGDFSKRYRHVVCQDEFRGAIEQGDFKALVMHLAQKTDCPELIALPVALYVYKTGVDDFCHSFDNSRV